MLLLHILSFFPCKASCLYNYLDFETNSNIPSSWPYVLGGKRVNCSWSFGVKRGDTLHTKPARRCKDERKKTDQQERLQKKKRNRRPRVLFSKHKWTVPCQLIPIMGLFYTRCGLFFEGLHDVVWRSRNVPLAWQQNEWWLQHRQPSNKNYYDVFWSSPCFFFQFLQRNQLTFQSLKLVFN